MILKVRVAGCLDLVRIDPEREITLCTGIYAKNKRNHDHCPHCPRLRDLVAQRTRQELLSALDPVPDPETIHAALAFQETAKPWGKPLAGPTDTQPIKIEATGFEVIDVEEHEEGP